MQDTTKSGNDNNKLITKIIKEISKATIIKLRIMNRIYSKKQLAKVDIYFITCFFNLSMQPASAHCDSFGPALKDAEKALKPQC